MRIGLFGPFDLTVRRGNSIRILLQAEGLRETGNEDLVLYGYKTDASLPVRAGTVGRFLVPKMLPIGQRLPRLPVDLVHVHHFYGATVLRQPYVIDLPSIISPQIEAMYSGGRGPLWKRLLLRRVLNPLYIKRREFECIRQAAAVIVASREIRDNLVRLYGLEKLKYYVVNNPVRLDVQPRAALRDYIVGLSASDFRDSMDAPCLEILRAVAAANPDIRFRVAGLVADRQRDGFRAAANVEFLGPLAHGDYRAFLTGLGAFLMPYFAFYDFGGSKFKLLEAGAAGVPVICSRFGAIGFDAVDCLCLADTPAELHDRLRELRDADRRAEYGERLREAIVRDHDHRTEAEKLRAVYREVCQ